MIEVCWFKVKGLRPQADKARSFCRPVRNETGPVDASHDPAPRFVTPAKIRRETRDALWTLRQPGACHAGSGAVRHRGASFRNVSEQEVGLLDIVQGSRRHRQRQEA